ncbi:MAG TPA: PKD domain-containing protein [Thermoanaerobaculia bacterium]|nr:PKD domain-containing protein [Thermoanaerobaculia bacterium]
MKRLSLFLLAVLSAAAAGATTIVMPTDAQLIAKSPVIVSGVVTSTYAVDRGGMIWTETTVSVDRILKGSAAPVITVATPGGEIDDRITKIYGAPEFTNGEHVLLFLEAHANEYRVMDLFVGKLSQGATAGGESLWLRDDQHADVTLLDADFHAVTSRNMQRDAARFETFLGARVRGEAGVPNYGVENPVLVKNAVERNNITANFTLIGDPTVYRWFQFDQGRAAQWYSWGTQPGYTGGGVTEIQTAMSSWTSYTQAKILYSYAGNASGTMGGLDRANGINEVLLNDPLGEISGTWNRNVGGVVGQGGFNGVANGGTWTAPFAADSAHPAGPIRAYSITEGNLTIQDGVSSATGLSSNRLAEIVAHEFGHTLGFGHSPDNSALMYATVTGLGPALRPDDQLAARWLYPNGTQTPPPTAPAAPSALTATPNGSSLVLNWTDNANNETGQSVWLANNTGSFQKVTDVAANVRTATLTGLTANTYRAYVTAFNTAGTSPQSNIATATIGSTSSSLVAAFNVSASTGIVNTTTFTFSDASTGGVTGWRWTFGDGGISTAQNPSHVYTTAATFTVTLTVSRSTESASTTRQITVTNGSPQTPSVNAAFSFAPTTSLAGDSVAFTDQSTGAPTRWTWNFGDGSTSTSQNPTHVFAASGTYGVTLTAANATTESSVTRNVTVAARPETYRSLVPVTAQTAGVGGTSWRTELSIFNPTGDTTAVTFTFVPGAGGSIRTRTMSFGPKATSTIDNALLQLFGISSGSGALAIEATSNGVAALKVSSRTFTGGNGATYGQAVPDVHSEDLDQTLYLTGIASNASFRTNVGLVNRGSNSVAATLTLYAPDGSPLGTSTLTLPASNFQQAPLASFFPNVAGGSYPALSLKITAASAGAVSAYASIVDNITQDPVYLAAMPQIGGSSMILPAVGRIPGANGTYWRSDVAFYNPTRDRMVVNARFLNAGADNRNASAKSFVLNGGETALVSDILSMMGLTSGTGALEIFWNGSSGPVVSSRTYTTVATGGTYGQSIDATANFASDVYVPGLRGDASYRSNAGFVNGSTDTIPVTVRLLAATGQELASTTLSLAPKSQLQYSINALFPNVNTTAAGVVTLHAQTSAGAKLFAYGSMVDNGSGDPVFFAGR